MLSFPAACACGSPLPRQGEGEGEGSSNTDNRTNVNFETPHLNPLPFQWERRESAAPTAAPRCWQCGCGMRQRCCWLPPVPRLQRQIVLPVYIEDNHAGTFYWLAQNIDLDQSYTLILFDAHSDASGIFDSDKIRDALRNVASIAGSPNAARSVA